MSASTAGQSGRPYVTVVVPAYCRESSIGPAVDRIGGHLGSRGTAHEIVIVDDGSPDRTSEAAARALRRTSGRLTRLDERRGPGFAVRAGVRAARGRWVFVIDADPSAPIEAYDRLATVCRDHDLDGAVGSRWLPDSSTDEPVPMLARLLDRSFGTWSRLLTRVPFRDVRGPVQLFDRDRLLPLIDQMVVDGPAWVVEWLFLCSRLSISVGEVPIHSRSTGSSAIPSPAELARMTFDVARVRWRFRVGRYPGAATG